MKSNEYKSKMVMIGLNQSKLAEALQVSDRTVARWLNETVIPKMAVLALEALEARHKRDNPNDYI